MFIRKGFFLLVVLTTVSLGCPMGAEADYRFCTPAGSDQVKDYVAQSEKVLSPNGVILAELPFEIIHGLPVVRLTLNRHPDRVFLLDSGSPSLIDQGTAVEFGLHLSVNTGPKVTMYGLGHTDHQVLVNARPVRMDFSKKFVVQGDISAVDLSAFSNEMGTRLAGVIGYDIFRQRPTLIDYVHQRVIFFDNKSFHPPTGQSSGSLDVDRNAMSPVIRATACVGAGHCGDANVLLDTGNNGPAVIYDGFASENHLLELSGWQKQETVGFVGSASNVHGNAGWLEIGNLRVVVPDFSLAIPNSTDHRVDPFDISLGSVAFGEGQILFDVKDGKIFLIGIGASGPPITSTHIPIMGGVEGASSYDKTCRAT
jgi:hypothetical protein